MKQVRIAFFSLVFVIFAGGGFAVLHAQTQPGRLPGDSLDVTTQQGVAFVKAEGSSFSRSILYIKRPNATVDLYDIAAITNQLYGFTAIDSIRHLSVIGMTPDGSRIILGAKIAYLDGSDGSHSTFYGILQIPWPITVESLGTNDITPWFLQGAPDIGSFHPEGLLSPDGTQWYATMRTSSQGNDTMRFYHGRVTGGAVDSATITGDITGAAPPQSGWNLSNLALDTTTIGGPTVLAAEVDGLESNGNQSERIMIMHWHPGVPPVASDFSGKIRGMQSVQDTIDALFAVTVAAVQDGRSVEVGLRDINTHDGTIDLYTTLYINASQDLTGGQSIPASILPAGTTFFAGRNSSQYSDDNPLFQVHGQGGDVILSNNGATALFITDALPENTVTNPGSPRNVKSGIFSYDFSQSQATLLYNDSNAQELQPVFVPTKDTTPHVPDIQSDSSTVRFGVVDTGSSSTKMFTITDPSIFDGTILDAATITGDTEFTIVSPKFPDTIMRNGSVNVQLLFTPVLPAAKKTATLTITSAMSTTKSISITLNGMAKAQPPNGVREDAALAQSMSIEPNPFTSIASVRLTAQDAGALGIVVHDALGRTVYTSPLQHVGTGASETFDFDAKSLGLPNGIYYVTALFGDRQVSRQVVFVR